MQGKRMEAKRRGCCTLIYCTNQYIRLLGSKRFIMGRSDQILINDLSDSSSFKLFERVSNLSDQIDLVS